MGKTPRSKPLSSASAGIAEGPGCSPSEYVTSTHISTREIQRAKNGDSNVQLDIILKIRRYIGGYKLHHDYARDQFYMPKEDIEQTIDLKILEAINAWQPGRCSFKSLATEYIKRSFDIRYVGNSYYEGGYSNIFLHQKAHLDVPEREPEEYVLDMAKIRTAIGNDRMYIALRLSMGLDGCTKIPFSKISEIVYGCSGKKISRQAIHSLVKRAKSRLKHAFQNKEELICHG